MNVSVYTPQQKVVDNLSSDAVILPSTNGDIEILDGHIPVVVSLKEGSIRVRSKNEDLLIPLDYGYAQFSNDRMTVVVQKTQVPEADINRIQKRARELAGQKVGLDEDITKDEFVSREESER
jgi:F-type H+-transporting ATPase subunit epsilon